ncbi:MAG: lysylphosphatidylglycerol synthase domain-containing protein [Woeseia sp.]
MRKIWLAVFAIFVLLFLSHYLRENKEALLGISKMDIRFIVLAAVSQLLYFLAIVSTWLLVLRSTVTNNVSFWEGLSHVLLVNFGKYIPGKVWGMTARGVRLRELGIGYDDILRATYIEQFILLSTGAWLGLLAAYYSFSQAIYLLAALGISSLILFHNYGIRLVSKVIRTLPKVSGFASLFDAHLRSSKLLQISASYISVWICLSAAFLFLSQSILTFGFTLANLSIFLLSLTAGYVGGFLAVFAPGGVGVREGIGATILSSVFPFEEALLLMLMFRVWTIVVELLAGSVVITRYYAEKSTAKR